MRKRAEGSQPEADKRPADLVAGLAGSIAHDYSNLLMVIRNSAAFLREDLDASDPRQQHVTALMNAADRARHLTEQLQAIGRSQVLTPEIVWPAEVIHDFADTLRHLVPGDVTFRITVNATAAPILFDAAQLPILLMRLVSYAADHARSHGHLLLVLNEKRIDKKTAAASEVAAGAFVAITAAIVEESGQALDGKDAFAPRLAGKHLPQGTDLRLASVHGLARQSGGFVDVTNASGHGPALTVYLPVAAKEHAQAAKKPRRIHMHPELNGSEIVLVVEDDDAVRNTVRDALERYGYTVLVASDGDAALRLLQLLTTPPDLLLTDLVMPEVTGRELIEHLNLEGHLPRVLMMSGYTDDDVLRRARPSEMYPFIKKPFTHQELALKVRQTLDDKQPRMA